MLLLALALNSRFGWSWTYSTADLVIAAAAIRQRKSKPGARTPANPNQPHPTHHRQVADAAGLFATPPHLTTGYATAAVNAGSPQTATRATT